MQYPGMTCNSLRAKFAPFICTHIFSVEAHLCPKFVYVNFISSHTYISFDDEHHLTHTQNWSHNNTFLAYDLCCYTGSVALTNYTSKDVT